MKNTNQKIAEETKAKLVALFSSDEFKALFEKTKLGTDTGNFRMIVSSEHTDRQGEIVMQDGIDTSNYMRNPVVLNSHDYYGIDNIVAMTLSLSKEMIDGVKSTVATGKFAPTESGQLARKLYEGGFLNAGSIGFIAKSFDAANDAIITTSEMLEWSFCSVPANAAALRLNAMGVTMDQLRAKGFNIEVNEEKGEAKESDEEKPVIKAGDVCQMPDGGEGTMQDDGNGNLMCMPKDAAETEKSFCAVCARDYPKGSLCLGDFIKKAGDPPNHIEDCKDSADLAIKWEAAKAKHWMHGKKDAQMLGAILAQLQSTVDNEIIMASRAILDIAQSEFAQSAAGKAEIAKVLKEHPSLQAIKKTIADAEQKLGIGEGEERGDGRAPNERSEDAQVVSLKELNEFLEARELVASIASVANITLSRINKKISEGRKSRNK